MKDHKEINTFLVKTFHEIIKIEETALSDCSNGDLSIKEFHLLEITERHCSEKTDNTAGSLAAELHITPGTLTTAVKNLERKGYLIRERDRTDRRSVHIFPTAKGKKATQKHEKFHTEMVEAITSPLSEKELEAFIKGLNALGTFFQEKDNYK